jgi:hypothetical protein
VHGCLGGGDSVAVGWTVWLPCKAVAMKSSRSLLPWLVAAISIPIMCIGMLLFCSWTYTTSTLWHLRAQGVYPSAEEAMNALIARSYRNSTDTQIIYAGTNSFDGSDPNVWYVIACVWGGTRVDGTPVGSPKHPSYDQPGTFFLATKEGWVFVPEGAFPELLGFWMRFYGLAGPGSASPSHDWGSTPKKGCEF